MTTDTHARTPITHTLHPDQWLHTPRRGKSPLRILTHIVILVIYLLYKYHSAHLRAHVVIMCMIICLCIIVYITDTLFHVYCVSTVCRIVPSCYFGRLRTFVAVIQPRFYARKIHFGTYIYLSAYFDRLHVANSLRITTSYIPLRDVFVPQESRTIESLSEGLPIRSS